MSKKAIEQANRNQGQAGRYNVRVIIKPKDKVEEIYDVKSWNHAGIFLALDHYGNRVQIINLQHYEYFVVTNQPEVSSEGESIQ